MPTLAEMLAKQRNQQLGSIMSTPGPSMPGGTNPYSSLFQRDEDEEDRLQRRTTSPEITTPLSVIGDVLSIGLYPVANVAKAVIQGDSNLAGAVWRGLTLQEKTTFTDLLDQYEVPMAPLLGFVLDVGLDVNTYFNFGAPILSKAFKGLKNSERVAKAMEVVKANSMVDVLGRAFDPAWKLPEKYYEDRKFFMAHFTNEQEKIITDVRKFAAAISPHERNLMAQATVDPSILDELSPMAQQKFLGYAKRYHDYLQRGVELGLHSEDLLNREMGKYMPAFYNEMLGSGAVKVTGSKFKPGFTREKIFTTYQDAKDFAGRVSEIRKANTVEEAYTMADAIDATAKYSKEGQSGIGAWIRTYQDLDKIKLFAKKVAQTYTPIEDYAVAFGLYANDFLRYEARSSFLEQTLNSYGKKVPANMPFGLADEAVYMPAGNLKFFEQEVAKGKYKVDDMAQILKSFGEQLAADPSKSLIEIPQELLHKIVGVSSNVETWMLPKEIAEDLNKTLTFGMGDAPGNALLKVYDKLLGTWKYGATVLRLPFHLRNLYSNPYQMWMGNVKAQEIVPTMIEGVKSLLGKGTDPTWFERMKDVGVIKSNFFTADFTDELTAFEKLTKGELQLKVDNILSLSRKFGGAIENISRAGMWIDGVKKGMDDRQAAQRVFKYLFNYEELTDFERNYLRRVIPFYTWTRKSVPMLVESALTNPNKLNTTLKAYDSIQHIVDLQEDDIKNLPDWMKKFGTFMLPWKDSKGNNLWASIDLPVGTLEKVAGMDIAGLFSGKTPFMDLWLVANNVKSFPTFGEKVEKFPGELTKAPFWAGWMPQPLMQALGIQPMKDRETRKMVLGWTKKTEQAVYAALPGLKEITNMIPGGGVDVEEEDATWRTMSYFTGVNLRPIDEREQMFYRRLKTKEAKAAYAKKIHQLGRRPTEEEREAYQQMIAKLR